MSEWDRLWKKIPMGYTLSSHWLSHVKAEGDTNQELAEKWFKLYKDLVEEKQK